MGATVKRAAALALLLLAASGPAFEPKKGRTRVSVNGVYGIRMTELSESMCRVEVVKDQDLAWNLDKCVGGADDLYFISDDGNRFWVLYPLPERGDAAPARRGRRKLSKEQSSLLGTVVAVEYDRKGNSLATRQLADFMTEPQLEDVRQLGKHFKWLAGVLSVPGNPPRLTAKGEVELETVASKVYNLKF